MIELTDEKKLLYDRLNELKKEFADLYTRKNEMLNYEEHFLTAVYLTTIGQKQYQCYSLRVEIAMIKHRTELMQDYLNRNEHPDLQAIDQEVTVAFAQQNEKLMEEARRLTKATQYLKSDFLEEEDARKIKDIYRLIVKKLHPDINPHITETQVDLFVKAQAAYELCKLDVLNEILLSLDLENKTKAEIPHVDVTHKIEQLETHIRKVSDQIEALEKRFPFSYRDKLTNHEWIVAEQKLLDEEIDTLTAQKQRNSEYLIILGLWKQESLN